MVQVAHLSYLRIHQIANVLAICVKIYPQQWQFISVVNVYTAIKSLKRDLMADSSIQQTEFFNESQQFLYQQ